MFLNKNQEEAVKNIDGPLLIIAGPGSGKTRTLVERVVYMVVEKEIKPEEIMVTTFTEKAVRELKTRIGNRLNSKKIDIDSLNVGTIHSICLKIIDKNIEYSNLKKGYRVLENIDQKFFMFSKLKAFKMIDGFDKFFEKKFYLSSWKKSENLLRWFNKISEEGKELNGENFIELAYNLYRKMLLEENCIDFSMIQHEAYRILKDNPERLKKLQNQIKYLMIDEYQDTNSIQEKLIFLIAGEDENICVVGDDDQGIYRFRGATIKNILNFESKLKKTCKIIKLETNYRSEKDIVKFCKNWIESLSWGEFRFPKELTVPEHKNIDETRVVKLSVEDSESKWQERVANFLIFLKKSGKIEDFNQVAFLFRSVKNRRITSLIHYLEYRGIGVYSPRSNLFFQRKEIKEIVGAMLYILLREENKIFDRRIMLDIEPYYRDCLNTIDKKIRANEKCKEELENLKKEYGTIETEKGGLLEVYYKILGVVGFKEELDREEDGILENRTLYNYGIFSKIVDKSDIISKTRDLTKENIVKITDYFFTMHLKFLKDSGIDEYEDLKEFAPKGAVSFLTIHQSKGLEFPVVVVGSLESEPDIEDEEEKELNKLLGVFDDFEPEYRIKDFDFWRLFYTAFSRAKNLLILTVIEKKRGKKIAPSLPFKRAYEMIPDILSGDMKFKMLELDKIASTELKEIYSYTSDLLKYRECPFKYKLDKIYGFERVRAIENFYGVLVHETLEFINKRIIAKEKIELEEIEEVYYTNYEKLKKIEAITLNEKSLEEGFRQVRRYFENEKNMYLNGVEAEKTLLISREDYLIEGKLDLIVRSGNDLKVVDFKTGSSEIEKEDLEKYMDQLKLYCYLLSEKSNEDVVGGEIYFIKNGKKVEVSYKKGGEIKVLTEFDEVVKKIREKDFIEKRYEEKKCQKCEFKNHC